MSRTFSSIVDGAFAVDDVADSICLSLTTLLVVDDAADLSFTVGDNLVADHLPRSPKLPINVDAVVNLLYYR